MACCSVWASRPLLRLTPITAVRPCRQGWTAPQLQQALEQVRQDAVASHRGDWLARHQPFSGVPERLRSLADDGVDWAVLTTKGRRFTVELLDGFDLHLSVVWP